jgi:hypothetical protein
MGGLKKVKTEGGSGGKRGHSGMEHWAFAHEIKAAARTQRRITDRAEARRGVAESAASSQPKSRAKQRKAR